MLDKHLRIERFVQAFWIFLWLPLWALLFIPWVCELMTPWPALLVTMYVGFLPTLAWLFVVEPILRGKR